LTGNEPLYSLILQSDCALRDQLRAEDNMRECNDSMTQTTHPAGGQKIMRAPDCAERKAIEEHKYYLSEAAGYDVGYDYALRDWEERYASEWRARKLAEDLAAQRDEILRHKWLLSEQAGVDLGQEAILDWIERFAAEWRKARGLGD
jgi:hypothetical protein